MARWRERWMAFWFEPSGPGQLGWCRLLFFGIFTMVYLHQDVSAWGEVGQIFWMPIPLFHDLKLPVFSVPVLAALQAIWRVALACSAIGLWTRLSTWVAAVLGVYFIGLPHNFGKIHHLDALVLLSMWILACSRCGDAWSLDRLIQRVRSGATRRQPVSGEYTWPIRLIWVMLSLVFFGAGISKLRHSGPAWMFSDSMAMIMVQSNTPLSRWFAQFGWLCQAIAVGTVLVETSAPLALFSRKARAVIVPGLFLMQMGITIIMRVNFRPFMVCYLFWVPWDRLGTWLKARVAA